MAAGGVRGDCESHTKPNKSAAGRRDPWNGVRTRWEVARTAPAARLRHRNWALMIHSQFLRRAADRRAKRPKTERFVTTFVVAVSSNFHRLRPDKPQSRALIFPASSLSTGLDCYFTSVDLKGAGFQLLELRPEHQLIADRAVREFAERIRALRSERGWSQERLAEESDQHRTYIGGIERALRNVSLHNIAKLATESYSDPLMKTEI